MHVVIKLYDDETVDIIDLGTMITRSYTVNQLSKLNLENIIGITSYNNQVLDIMPMKIISFPTEYEAMEYKGNCPGMIIYGLDYWWVLIPDNHIIHVDYYVYTQVGEEITYVSKHGYTPYIQGAKSFSKVDAIKRANSMTKNSKTCKYWNVQRVPRG